MKKGLSACSQMIGNLFEHETQTVFQQISRNIFFQIREYICLGAACAQRLWNDLCEHERVIRQVCKCICSEHTFVWVVLCEQYLVRRW